MRLALIRLREIYCEYNDQCYVQYGQPYVMQMISDVNHLLMKSIKLMTIPRIHIWGLV
jgi:hypothetical protein